MTDFIVNWNKEAKDASDSAFAEAMQFATFGNELADYVPLQHIVIEQDPLWNTSPRAEYRRKLLASEKVWTSIDGEDFSNNG